jgi:hypothetical protein
VCDVFEAAVPSSGNESSRVVAAVQPAEGAGEQSVEGGDQPVGRNGLLELIDDLGGSALQEADMHE